jgi:hypothetical protein
MNKKALFLIIFNFFSLCFAFGILPFNQKAFNYSNSPEIAQLVAKGLVTEALFKAEQFGFKSGIDGYRSFVVFTFVTLIINFVALIILFKKKKSNG